MQRKIFVSLFLAPCMGIGCYTHKWVKESVAVALPSLGEPPLLADGKHVTHWVTGDLNAWRESCRWHKRKGFHQWVIGSIPIVLPYSAIESDLKGYAEISVNWNLPVSSRFRPVVSFQIHHCVSRRRFRAILVDYTPLFWVPWLLCWLWFAVDRLPSTKTFQAKSSW